MVQLFVRKALVYFMLGFFAFPMQSSQSFAQTEDDASAYEVEKGPAPETYNGCEARYAREVKICQTRTCFARLYNRLTRCQKIVLARFTHGNEKRKMFIDGDLSEISKEEVKRRHQAEKMRTKNRRAAEDAASSF